MYVDVHTKQNTHVHDQMLERVGWDLLPGELDALIHKSVEQ